MVSNMSAAREDAREAVRESTKTAAAASKNIQADLDALRDDVASLAKRLSVVLADHGTSAWLHAKSGLEDTLTGVQKKARETGEDLDETIQSALKKNPYTTLAVAVGLGFLFGATWRR